MPSFWGENMTSKGWAGLVSHPPKEGPQPGVPLTKAGWNMVVKPTRHTRAHLGTLMQIRTYSDPQEHTRTHSDIHRGTPRHTWTHTRAHSDMHSGKIRHPWAYSGTHRHSLAHSGTLEHTQAHYSTLLHTLTLLVTLGHTRSPVAPSMMSSWHTLCWQSAGVSMVIPGRGTPSF